LLVHAGLERAGAKEKPAIIGAAQAVTRRRRQASLGKRIGEISADGGRFGHDRVTMSDRRHFAHRIDCEIGRRLHRRAVLEQLGAVGPADLLQHPSDDPAARLRMGIEDELIGHWRIPLSPFHVIALFNSARGSR
jgi:hypothetical protein